MTNEKNKINELVFDDDPTAELEVAALRQHQMLSPVKPLERDERTSDLESTGDLEKRFGCEARVVSKLQYDIEQLRSRWQGVEAENKAREKVIMTLTAELQTLRDALASNSDLIVSRNEEIESLKSELRNQETKYRATSMQRDQEIANMREAMRFIPEPLESAHTLVDGATDHNRYQRTEAYADSLRRKLQDLITMHDKLKREHERLALSLQLSGRNERQLAAKLATVSESRNALAKKLVSVYDEHAEEIRLLRFELAEAQDTVAQNEQLNSQLASDLIDTRGFKEELEQMISDHDAMSRTRIGELEKELFNSRRIADDLTEKLEARGDTINAMLTELARRPEQFGSTNETDGVIANFDERIAEQFDEATDLPTRAHKTNDRVARMLLGKAGDKLLRFPLFKDRLTIGRTRDNDIHLHSTYISRRHAVVQTDGDTTRVIDWGSRNGVFVNSKRITEHFLQNGDIVTIGNVHFRYDERPKRDN